MHKSTFLPALFCIFAQTMMAQSGQQMFDNTYVHEIRVYFEQPNFWEILTLNYNFEMDNDPNTSNQPILAKVKIDGTEVDSVAVNQKGFFSNWGAGSSLKKPLKLDFNEFADGEYDNLKSLNLQNAFKDPSFMRDMLSYQILRDFGVAAPRSSYAKVYLNDELWGLYVVVESVNKTFLKEHFGDNDGNLYKAGFTSMKFLGNDQQAYYMDFELKTNETANDWSGLIDFLDIVNNTPDHLFRDSLVAHLDMDSYLKSMAVDVSIVNWDSHFDHGRNFYLYDNPATGKFHWIPWDYNLAFAGSGFNYDITLEQLRNQFEYDKILPKRVLDNDEIKEEYLQIACELHQEIFTNEHLDPIIDVSKDLIINAIEEDPNKFFDDLNLFELSLGIGFETLIVDSFHLVDSSWNGSMWVVIDTVFVFQYWEGYPGLKSLIADRHFAIQSELSNDFGVECLIPTEEPTLPLAGLKLEIWPNPTADLLQIRAPEAGGTLSLFDVHGRLLKRGQFEGTQFVISVSDYKPGVYWAECVSSKGRSLEKFIVAR